MSVIMDEIFFLFKHILSESIIDDRFILVVLVVDKVGKFLIVVKEILEVEDEIVPIIDDGVLCSCDVLLISLPIPELLNEGSEFLFHLVPEILLWHFVESLDKHGA